VQPPERVRLPDAVLDLVRPAPDHLPSYKAALERGWSPDTVRGAAAAGEELARIAADPAAFLASLDDVAAKGKPIALPDGSRVPRLPGYRRWLWDGEFCGSIGFRWQPGTADLPPYVLGHIGYSVVPWKQGRGYARRALGLTLRDAALRGLPHVDLTTDPDNIASQRVIIACGGELVHRFRKPASYGEAEGLLYRIRLARAG
jgi:predicted acetyltransferase